MAKKKEIHPSTFRVWVEIEEEKWYGSDYVADPTPELLECFGCGEDAEKNAQALKDRVVDAFTRQDGS